MDKPANAHGFTLIELMFVLAISGLFLIGVIPNMNTYMAKQQLKLAAAEMTGYIQSARNHSATTECKSEVVFRPANKRIEVEVKLARDLQWRGCNRWFEAGGHGLNKNSVTIRQGSIDKAELKESVSLQFNGVSGNLDGGSSKTLELETRNVAGRIRLQGIGNGVFEYVDER